MQITPASVYDTGLRSLQRLAVARAPERLLLSTQTGTDVWEMDWQSKHLLVRSCARPALHNVRAIMCSAGGAFVVDSDTDRGDTWLVNLGSSRRQRIARGSNAFTAACSPSLDMIALGGDRRITLLQWPGGRRIGELAGHNEGPRDMAFSPNGRSLVSIGGESEDEQHRDAIRLWDVPGLSEQRSWLWHHLGAVAFHPGGRWVAVGCIMPAAIKLWDLETDTIETEECADLRAVTVLCFSPDGRRLCAGSPNGRLMLFEAH
jgi:WD40 repeat protein